MTKSELLAQAEALEWVFGNVDISTGAGRLWTRIAELRAEAEKAADPQPVAWMVNGIAFADKQFLLRNGYRDTEVLPLYAHPDPRIAELERLSKAISADCNTTALERNAANARIAELLPLLRALDSLTNLDDNFDSAINPGPERDELLAAYTACKGLPR